MSTQTQTKQTEGFVAGRTLEEALSRTLYLEEWQANRRACFDETKVWKVKVTVEVEETEPMFDGSV